ncbi:NADPH:quinone oxidoreductase family protein [Nakamurella leprariae]|uniref:NADPH:quinone oxidoreductase family protein n=1 Tax=Nakamurella leprariae TaxID=2803911 RepID=A0A938YHJ6_9ACTN|nr:NADPH:quinone oxidoreductase family protein [Nakamurella leprariae]MBM9467930.1 NADPH:quinone oxidoreductase family protein [Nakamurella leprariae]
MKAFQLHAYEGPAALRLVDVPAPVPGPHDLLIRVAAIGVNYPDLLTTRGRYQFRPDPPFVPGCEVAGTVQAAPDGSGFAVGDRVCGFTWEGGFAEQTVLPAASAAPVPDDVDLVDAAAILVNHQTALFALQRRAALRAGEVVLVLGGAGGIGTAAIQVATGLGARVIAGVSRPERVEVAAAAGADDVLVLEPGFAARVKELAGRGVDVVVDPVGDWLFDEAVRCLAPEGRIVVVGFAAGGIPKIGVNRVLLRNISVIGAAWGAFQDLEPGLIARQAATLDGLARQGFVRPQLDSVVPFEQLPEVLERLGRGEVRGKAVVTLGRPSVGGRGG